MCENRVQRYDYVGEKTNFLCIFSRLIVPLQFVCNKHLNRNMFYE